VPGDHIWWISDIRRFPDPLPPRWSMRYDNRLPFFGEIFDAGEQTGHCDRRWA